MLAALVGVLLLLLGEFAVRELACVVCSVNVNGCMCDFQHMRMCECECVSWPKQHKYPLKLHNHEG